MSWYFDVGKESDVVISTRIRLARNIANINFLNKISNEDEEKILENFKNEKIVDLSFYKLSEVDDITKQSLVEKYILSKDILNKKNGAFLLSDDESISVLINEEDHIRIQSFESGFDFENAYKKAKVVDKEIAKIIEYAYSEKYGYLTTCPTNLGSGIRASLMLHLPALRISGRIQRILDVVNKANITVRGVYGEGTSTIGDLYQVSNKVSLGVSDEEVINSIKNIANTIIKKEREARELLIKTGIDFEDKLYRMFGNLVYAKKIDYNECSKLVSNVKLGVDLGIIKEIDLEKINKIRILCKVASLQKHFKRNMDADERDAMRGRLIREIIK